MLRMQRVMLCFSSCMVIKLGRSIPIMMCTAGVCLDGHLNAVNNLSSVKTAAMLVTAALQLRLLRCMTLECVC